MPKMDDAYGNGVEVCLNCLQCDTTIFTPKDAKEGLPILISELWKVLHTDRFPDHIVKRLVHYYA